MKPVSRSRRALEARSSTPRLVAYARVSTHEQAEHGLSLQAQRHRLRAFAEAMGFEVVALEADEGVSGKVAPDKRPALSRALASVRAGKADGLLTLKLDRLSRSTRDVLDLVDASGREGWRLLSVSEQLDTATAAGRMVLTVLAALAQMEREQIGERTSFGMRQLVRDGRRRSRFAPFGFRHRGAAVVEVAEEGRVLERMRALHANGFGAWRIAAALDAEGERNPRTGRQWNYGTVAAILRTAARRDAAAA
jgi:site-specific DNA recombinase